MNDRHGIGVTISRLVRGALDFLLPATDELRFLERASAGEFAAKARRATNEPDGIISLFDYRDPLVKTAIWHVKFRGNMRVTRLVGSLLYEHLISELAERELFEGFGAPVIVPVPLARERLRERGFNQTERLAHAMRSVDHDQTFTVANAVARTRETASQTKTKSRAERLTNVRGAFAVVDIKAIRGRNVIILDDVTTTGSTIGEMRAVLEKAGARKVLGLTFAH